MTYQAKQGHRYRAKIEIGFLKRSFASEDVIASKLREAGFSGVRVWKTGGGTYGAEATWTGPDASADLPSEIVSVADLGSA